MNKRSAKEERVPPDKERLWRARNWWFVATAKLKGADSAKLSARPSQWSETDRLIASMAGVSQIQARKVRNALGNFSAKALQRLRQNLGDYAAFHPVELLGPDYFSALEEYEQARHSALGTRKTRRVKRNIRQDGTEC